MALHFFVEFCDGAIFEMCVQLSILQVVSKHSVTPEAIDPLEDDDAWGADNINLLW